MKHKIWIVVTALWSVHVSAVIDGRAAHLPEVVKLQSEEKICSGTIVGPRAILSAAHCATSKSPHFAYRGQTYRVKYVTSRAISEGHDLALAITERKIRGARIALLGQGIRHGSEMLIAGYGCTRAGGRPGRLHMGRTRVIGMDQDHLLSGVPKGSVLCEGDSGGPAFVREGNGYRLVAVNSLSDIRAVNINVRTDSALSQEFFRSAAAANGIQICGVNGPCE